MKVLTRTASIYVPTPSSPCPPLGDVREGMARLFGGCTSLEVRGWWLDGDGHLIDEPVEKVYSWTTVKGLERCAGKVRELALKMGKALGQECVLVEIGSRAELLEVV